MCHAEQYHIHKEEVGAKWENNKKREMKSNRVTSLEKYFISLQCQEKSVFYIIFLNKKIINNHHRYDST